MSLYTCQFRDATDAPIVGLGCYAINFPEDSPPSFSSEGCDISKNLAG